MSNGAHRHGQTRGASKCDVARLLRQAPAGTVLPGSTVAALPGHALACSCHCSPSQVALLVAAGFCVCSGPKRQMGPCRPPTTMQRHELAAATARATAPSRSALSCSADVCLNSGRVAGLRPLQSTLLLSVRARVHWRQLHCLRTIVNAQQDFILSLAACLYTLSPELPASETETGWRPGGRRWRRPPPPSLAAAATSLHTGHPSPPAPHACPAPQSAAGR